MIVTWCAACADTAAAQSSADTTFHAVPKPTLNVHRTTGAIRIDGNLDDPGWKDAARTSDFSEHFPVSQSRPPVATEAWVTYDSRNLYLAFVCEDKNPGIIRSMLRDRDEIYSDDFIGIMLDTFGDNRFIYEIYVNPIGCQGDLSMTQGGNNEDSGFDLIYESEGRITDRGYQVEVAVPFKSLRFPVQQAQTWRANFWRTHPRETRSQYTWAALSRDESCFTCQFGTLTGIRDVTPGGTLDLIPAVVGSQAGNLVEPEGSPSRWDDGSAEGQVSLTGRYALTSNLTAEATLNPDFSQVESDPGEIDVNNTFALFYNERRPFFQEGSDLFDTWIDAVYTRTINNPDVAGKVTGQSGKTSVAYLIARDHESPYLVPFPERSRLASGGRSTSNVFRLRRSLNDNSHLGILATDRRLDDGGSGTVAGLDGSFRLSRRYTVEGQFLFSHTREPDDTAILGTPDSTESPTFDGGAHTIAFDGEGFDGHALYGSVERNSALWNVNLDWWEYSPAFRAENGFITRNDNRQLSGWTGWNFRPESKWVSRIEPNVEIARVWNFDGLRKDEWLVPAVNGQFRWQTNAGYNWLWSMERFHGNDFRGIRRWNGWVESNFSRYMSLEFAMTRGHSIARNQDPPVLGFGTNVSVAATLKPASRLVIQPELDYAKMDHRETHQELFEGYILRTRFNVQVSRELSARIVTQYDDFDREFAIEPLVTYRVNPFTVFYAGSNLALVDQGGELDRVSRQFFFKAQYLFRL